MTDKKKKEKKKLLDLQCSVCLETLNEPVTLLCQHNFCRACLKDEVKKCPICRTNVFLPPRKTINVLLKNLIIKIHGETAYNTMYNSRAHDLLKNDMKEQVRDELREELWRSVSEEIPNDNTASFIVDDDEEEEEDEDSDYEGEGEEFKFGFRFNEINHTTYWIIIITMILVIVALIL